MERCRCPFSWPEAGVEVKLVASAALEQGLLVHNALVKRILNSCLKGALSR